MALLWPVDVVRYFAARTSPDTIFKPAESVRSVSVGALNPPLTEQVAGLTRQIHDLLTERTA